MLVIESSLQTFFFDELLAVNKRCSNPLPSELIFYSSLVMDRFGMSENFFELVEGRVRDKILGVKLLESGQFSGTRKKETLRDIGDTALFLCGYFSKSLEKKIVDPSYYQELGKTAYKLLDKQVPSFYDVPEFYKGVSNCFNDLTLIMGQIQQKYFNEKLSDEAYLILNDKSIKAS